MAGSNDQSGNAFLAAMAAYAQSALPGTVGNPISTATSIKHFSGDAGVVPGTGTPSPAASEPHGVAAAEGDLGNPGAPGLTVADELTNLIAAGQTDPNHVLAVQQNLIDAGLLKISSGSSYHPGSAVEGDATFNAYKQALLGAVATGMNINDYLTNRIQQLQQSGVDPTEVTKSRTKTSTIVDLSNSQTAQGVLYTAMSNILGRMPTPDEISTFKQSLNAQQQASPQLQTQTVDTTTQMTANGLSPLATDTSLRDQATSGGIDPSVAAENFVRSNDAKEADQYSIGNYVSLFEKALKGNG